MSSTRRSRYPGGVQQHVRYLEEQVSVKRVGGGGTEVCPIPGGAGVREGYMYNCRYISMSDNW
jgi:hypothetical protein